MPAFLPWAVSMPDNSTCRQHAYVNHLHSANMLDPPPRCLHTLVNSVTDSYPCGHLAWFTPQLPARLTLLHDAQHALFNSMLPAWLTLLHVASMPDSPPAASMLDSLSWCTACLIHPQLPACLTLFHDAQHALITSMLPAWLTLLHEAILPDSPPSCQHAPCINHLFAASMSDFHYAQHAFITSMLPAWLTLLHDAQLALITSMLPAWLTLIHEAIMPDSHPSCQHAWLSIMMHNMP